jgi:hypothetical protein
MFGAAEDRPPAARDSPPSRSCTRRDPPAFRVSWHRLPKNGTRPRWKRRAPAETAPQQLSETSPPATETRRPPLDAWALNRRPPAVERAEPYTDSGTRHTYASCYDRTGRKSSLSHPNFDVAAKIGSPTSTRLGEGSPAPRNPRVHDQGSRHTTRKTTESIAHSLPNGRPSEAAGWNPVQKTRLVETFPMTPRSPFLPNR